MSEWWPTRDRAPTVLAIGWMMGCSSFFHLILYHYVRRKPVELFAVCVDAAVAILAFISISDSKRNGGRPIPNNALPATPRDLQP